MEDEEERPFLVAQPPNDENSGKMESQMDVANGIAFQTVDDLYYSGKLTSTEMAMYKARYIKLHDALKKSRESEYKLHQLMKFCLSEVERQEVELAKTEQFPDNAITEPLIMRAQIINTYNNGMETEERVESLIYEEGLLMEERKLLKRDYSRLPTAELEALGEDIDIFKEMENRNKAMNARHQECYLEIDMLRLETKRNHEQLRAAKDTLEDVHLEHSDAQLRLNRVKADWVLASALPGQYIKETEKARKYKSDHEKQIKGLEAQKAGLMAQKQRLENELLVVITSNENCKGETNKGKAKATSNKEITKDLFRRFQAWQDLEMNSRTEKAKLMQRMENCAAEKKEYAQEQTKLRWEKDNALKQYKKSQMQLEVLTESVKNIRSAYEKVRARFTVTPKYDNTLQNRKNKLNELVRVLHSQIIEEGKRTAAERIHVNQAVLLSERRLYYMENSRAESIELLRLATALTEDMAKAVCEFNGAHKKFTRLSENCESKLKFIAIHMEDLNGLDDQLNEVSKMYTEVKMERNKCVSLLQAAVQVSSDTRERLRQRGNESEILLTVAQRRDSEMMHIRKHITELIGQRDQKRHDLCKVAAVVSIQNGKREQMRQAIARLNLMYNQAESSIIALKKACERNARLRNERAILLIERNQEVYLLQERMKSQDIAMASAKMDLSGLESEYQCSELYLKQVQHIIHLVREQVPKKIQLEGAVHGLIQELIGIRAKKAQLVSWYEDPDRSGRLRLLGGVDPSQSELWVILGQLEKRLASKEEGLSEKNLTYEAICRLVDALRVRADANKDDTLRLALQVNGVQLKLLRLRKQMETKYSELIISNSEQNKLQQEVGRLEKHLDICTIRMLSGMPPSREIDNEYELVKRRERIRREYKREKSMGPQKIQPMKQPCHLKLPAISNSKRGFNEVKKQLLASNKLQPFSFQNT